MTQQIIEQIINELIDINTALTVPLLKTKVFASRVGNTSLLKWVELELNGYKDNKVLPEYRIKPCALISQYLNLNTMFKNHQISISNIPKEYREYFSNVLFQQPIAVLESMNNKNIEFNIEDIERQYIENLLRENNPNLQLISIKRSISVTAVTEICTDVRNSLLDIMLQIEREYGHEINIKEISNNPEKLNKIIMSTNFITNTGDGNTINTGNNTQINTQMSISKNDIDSLKQILKENNVTNEDIDKLIQIIDTEEPLSRDVFGIKVNTWIQNMIGKALNKTWDISVGAAGSLLADIISKYYFG